ncbi:MAG: TraR/DksA family transcriptional regulator [Roseateles asaccharophilus]|jgi:RNA polymerase-binding protein DksA|uniref:TraR/DksA family transcriptional regulator n=1 Tax=Roseateles asaccharophilus TaxID=582607 RepID=UPI00391B5F61
MSTLLTAGQKAQLQSTLLLQRRELEREFNLQLGEDANRVEHASAALASQEDEPAHRADRDVDLARSDLTLQSLRAIDAALDRLEQPDYGFCQDCGQPIAFDRLRLNPQSLCCTGCQSEREQQGAGQAQRHTL